MASILDEIFAHKRDEVDRKMLSRGLTEVQAEAEAAPPPLDFIFALHAKAAQPGFSLPGEVPVRQNAVPALIAEVKRRSPSRGILAPDFDPVRLAGIYRENGAAAISVLTDERFFGGCLEHLSRIAADRPGESRLQPPLLRKDFISDPYQIYEARAARADAVLLIAAALPPVLLEALHDLALELGMAPLVEVHTQDELETALNCRPRLVGINNRDLHDFTTRLETTLHLRPLIPAGITVVAESGIHSAEDVELLAEAGVDAILVGEALVTAGDVPAKVRELSKGERQS